MLQALPLRDGRTLSETALELRVAEVELRRWLVQGRLRAHVWVPVTSVFEESGPDEPHRLRHWEGYAPLSRHYCERLFRRGEVRLRDFVRENPRRRLMLPHSADDFIVTLSDLVILEADRLAGMRELEGSRQRTDAAGREVEAMPSFRRVRMGEEEHPFGAVQAATLRLLYESARGGSPWRNGKQLLREAGSQCFTLSNLFKRKPVWRELIDSDGRGYYRLRESVLREIRRGPPIEGDRVLPPDTPPPPPPPAI